jgi:DNA-directed RNA polymerase alpha subunit
LESTVRAYNCLRGAGITKVGEIETHGKATTLAIRNFGKKSLGRAGRKNCTIKIIETYLVSIERLYR